MDIETNYNKVVSNGTVLKKSSRHNRKSMCDCDFDSELGSYRDVEVEYDGHHYFFYHSTAIVIKLADGRYRLSTGGWNTKSTKERINKQLPPGYKIEQDDYEWHLDMGEVTIEFTSPMILDHNGS